MLRRLAFPLALILLAPLAAAQDTDADAAQQAAKRRAERALRGYRSLQLTDAQRKAVLELLIAEELVNAKARDERRAKVKALLESEQAEKFQAMIDRSSRGRSGRGGSSSGGGNQSSSSRALRMVGLDHQRFVGPLKLDDSQRKQLDALLEPAGKKLVETYQQQRQGGQRWDYDKWRAFALTLRQEIRPKIAKFLTDEQKEKFAEINKTYDDQVNRYYQRWQERRAQREGGGGSRSATPAASQDPARVIEALTAAAMKALNLGAEEAAVLGPLVEQLIRHKILGTRNLANRRERIGKAAADEAKARAELGTYRTQRTEYQTKLKELQDGLRELLTLEQEAGLVALDLLP